MDSGDWRTQLLPDSRQRILNQIMETMETLHRYRPVSGLEGVQDLMKIALRFEEEMYNVATSQQDYLQKISLKMLTMLTNPASSGQNSLGLALLDSSAQTGNANGADWQEEAYQKIKSMKEMHLSDLNYIYQKIASLVQQHPQHEKVETLKKFKMTLERIVLFLGLNKHDIQFIHKEKLLSVEKHISFFLSYKRPHKPTSSPLQGQLPQPSMHTSQAQNTYAHQTPTMDSDGQYLASEFDRLLSLID